MNKFLPMCYLLGIISLLPKWSFSCSPNPSPSSQKSFDNIFPSEIVSTRLLNYPDIRRDESVVDDYYGVKVRDPYRYLEDPDSEETKGFINAQNKLTDEFFGRDLGLKRQIEKKIKQFSNYRRFWPTIYGNRFLTQVAPQASQRYGYIPPYKISY